MTVRPNPPRPAPARRPPPAAWLLLLVAACAAAPAERASVRPEVARARLVELARADSRVQEHLSALCLDIGPRLTGSQNYERAAQWARDELASYGLDARLEPWGELAVGFDRGPWSGGLAEPERIDFDFTTPAWTPGTGGPARGALVPYPVDEDELAALGSRAAGAWVLRPAGAGAPELARAWREQVDAKLVELGALGVISSSGGELVRTSGDMGVEWGALPRLVRIVLRDDQHEDLEQRLARGERAVCEFDVDNRFRRGPLEQVNVVADLRGSERPGEYVIVCGHLDSWDGAAGALDNGTGVATTLEAARLLSLSGARPKRTIRFILWGGEEQGLLGSRAYVARHEKLLPRISAVLNHDGGTNHLSGLGITPEMLPQLAQACAPVLDLDPRMPFELAVGEALPGSGSSDHAPFVRAGVPGFFWQQSGRSDYRHHHHTQHDHFAAAIPEYQRHSALVAALVAYGIADLPALLERRNMAPLEPRRMGVQLDGMRVTEVDQGSRAAAAGWQPGDVILAVDGEPVDSSRAVVASLQADGPRKSVLLERDGMRVETVLDWSDEPAEKERARRRAEREARGFGDLDAPRSAGRASE